MFTNCGRMFYRLTYPHEVLLYYENDYIVDVLVVDNYDCARLLVLALILIAKQSWRQVSL